MSLSSRRLLFFLVGLFQLFHHLAFPVTVHFRLVFIYAPGGIPCRIEIIISYDQRFLKGLKKQCGHKGQYTNLLIYADMFQNYHKGTLQVFIFKNQR